jgi:predicted enzyme related to lactoylglutathione lyase
MDYTSQALDEVRRFYTELLGFTSHELDPRRDSLRIQLSPSSSLGFMPPVEGPPEEWRPPREPALYLVVADVDRAHADLVAKGVEFMRPPEDTSYGHRLAILKDPEGRVVCLAHPLKR